MKRLLFFVLMYTAIMSCTKIKDNQTGSFLTGNGVFILNEGNFRGGNGSLSFYSYDSAKIYNDLFYEVNGRPLGDVPNSIAINGEYAFILVNNSGKIEVINRNTLESVKTIPGVNSPRNISFITNNKAYVTSMYSDSVTIINLNDKTVSGYINIRRSSEAIAISGSNAYIANWVGGDEIMIINTINDKVIDSVKVGAEPESMVIDKNNMLWVLCNGGWARENFAELIEINTVTNSIEKSLVFNTKQASPSCLQIDGRGETLYYLESGVKEVNIDASVLPSSSFISESGHYFYKLGINPANSDIFITDAVDYQQKGFLLYYKKDGTFVSSQKADIIPGLMCFKLN